MNVELTEWERDVLAAFAAGNALTFMAHNTRGGLFDHEKETMEKWKALSAKLERPI